MDFRNTQEEHTYWHERLRERFGMNGHPEDYVSIAFPDMFQRPNSKGEMKPRDQGEMSDEEYEAYWGGVHEQNLKSDIVRWQTVLSGETE